MGLVYTSYLRTENESSEETPLGPFYFCSAECREEYPNAVSTAYEKLVTDRVAADPSPFGDSPIRCDMCGSMFVP